MVRGTVGSQIVGPLLSLSVAGVIELLRSTPLAVPNPPAFLLLTVVFVAYRWNVRAALASAAIAWLYIAYFFSLPGQPFQYNAQDGRRVLVWAITIPLMTLMVAALQRRTTRAHRLALENAQLRLEQQALKAAQEHEASFRLMFERNPLAMWVYDLETLAFLEVNTAAIAHYGYSRTEFLTMRITDMRPQEDVPRLLEHLETTHPDYQVSGPWRHRRKDGQLLTVRILSHSLTFSGRRAALVVIDDITERTRLEAQLLQSQKMEGIGRLAGGIAHDFNNLLTAIRGTAELAASALLPEHPAREDLQTIQENADRATALTRQLLAFARKQMLEPHVINLNDVLVQMEKLLRRVIRTDIELIIQLAPELWNVKVDPGQIEQVLVNLAVNASDAMPTGGHLTIETGNVVLDTAYARGHISVDPGPYVMVAVSDTGVGMPPEVQARLFEPFFTTKEAGKGTGLGLATSYGIVKQHGGNIWFYSEVGQGTTIKVYLPRVKARAETVAAHDQSTPAGHGTETVLVAEDEEAVRRLAVRVLQTHGYRVLEASNGAAALRLARAYEGAIHLLLIDMVMPEVGGKGLADQLRLQYPRAKVLFMSGYTNDVMVQHGRLDERAAFLQKPFTPDDLARKVRAVLDA
jgi:two-component system, cell cycle sensor histidine kinase and response regulator CckA